MPILSALKKLLTPKQSPSQPAVVPPKVPVQHTPTPPPPPVAIPIPPLVPVPEATPEPERVVDITLSTMKRLFPDTPQSKLSAFVPYLNKYLTHEYGFTTKARTAAFLAQTGHESGYYSTLIENLNYSEAGLLKTFKKYFTPAQAKQYARKPSAIASRVYANRLGNGPESSGDGWTYRGMGLIQLTGKYNQTEYSKWAKSQGFVIHNLMQHLTSPEGAVLSSIWYWTVLKSLHQYSDRGEAGLLTQTKLINGGTNGWADRLKIFNQAIIIL